MMELRQRLTEMNNYKSKAYKQMLKKIYELEQKANIESESTRRINKSKEDIAPIRVQIEVYSFLFCIPMIPFQNFFRLGAMVLQM